MEQPTLSSKLRELVLSSPNRSKAARLRLVLDDIEAAIAAGVPSSEIIATIEEQGISLSAKTFHGTLYRLRQERMNRAARPTHTPSAAPATSPLASVLEPPSATPTRQRHIETIEQLTARHPTMSRIQIAKMHAAQYDRPAPNRFLDRTPAPDSNK